MPPIQVLIAEDHALLVDALQMLLGTQSDMRCVGAARDGEQALAMAQARHPQQRRNGGLRHPHPGPHAGLT